MSKLSAWLEVESHRAYLYRLAFVVGPILITAGVISSGDAAVYLQVLGALLGVGGTGLAAKKTSTAKGRHEAGNVDVLLLLSVLTFVGVVLLLFGVSFR